MRIAITLCLAVLAAGDSMAQTSAPAAAVSRFVGTWVGTQNWAIADPPPGSRQDQPVTLVIENTHGKLHGTMTPFLDGEDGATIVEAAAVGSRTRSRY